jgi:hypothetical protein
LLTLAGRDDPNDGQTFESVILDQIEKLRKSIDDEPGVYSKALSRGFTPTRGYIGEGGSRDVEGRPLAFREACTEGKEGHLKCFPLRRSFQE